METDGLAHILKLKGNARVMLTSNIDVIDKLSNGQIGTVFHIKLDSNQAVTNIFIQFDDDCTDKFARRNNCIPIESVEAKIKVKTTKLSSPEIKRTQVIGLTYILPITLIRFGKCYLTPSETFLIVTLLTSNRE